MLNEGTLCTKESRGKERGGTKTEIHLRVLSFFFHSLVFLFSTLYSCFSTSLLFGDANYIFIRDNMGCNCEMNYQMQARCSAQ